MMTRRSRTPETAASQRRLSQESDATAPRCGARIVFSGICAMAHRLERAEALCFDRRVPSTASESGEGIGSTAQQPQDHACRPRAARGAEAELRGLLLPRQPALRAGCGRALLDLPSPRGAAQAAAADAVRVPPGAAHPRGLVVPLGAGAGGAARLAKAVRRVVLTRERRRGYIDRWTCKLSAKAVATWHRRTDLERRPKRPRPRRNNRYVQRLIEDEELRANLLAAYGAARSAYGRMTNGKPAGKALLEDRKLQAELRNAVESLRDAGGALREEPGRRRRRRRRARPHAAADHASAPSSRSPSTRACARRSSTSCSGPRSSSTTARRPRRPRPSRPA